MPITVDKYHDQIYVSNWRTLIDVFHEIENTEQNQDAINSYENLIKVAMTKTMTPRQTVGIIDRCNYRISLIKNPTQQPFANSEK